MRQIWAYNRPATHFIIKEYQILGRKRSNVAMLQTSGKVRFYTTRVLPVELHERLKREAKRRKVTLETVVNVALDIGCDWLEGKGLGGG